MEMTKREDGLYVQIYALNNGVPYILKTIPLKDLATTFTTKILDGVEELATPTTTENLRKGGF